MRGRVSEGAVRRSVLGTLTLVGFLIAGGAARAGVDDARCPSDAIAVEPGTLIQIVADRAGAGASLCLKNGIHRAQAVRPLAKQKFYGEGRSVLNGSRVLTGFRREESFWVLNIALQRSRKHGECLPSAPICNQPEAVFIDDRPLIRLPGKNGLGGGKFFIDYAAGKIYLGDDPTNRTVELTVASFAFESTAADVLISNITVEKFASAAQKGAIHSREGTGWTIEKCEARLNSGAGISVGTGSHVRNCDIHHNGQIGIEGNGNGIRIENNRIWSNNIHGFDATWEAGGVKIALSDGVTFRGNHVYDNDGPGLWCDIDCRNVLYEENLVENNQDVGIFHEISFKAVIRNNVLRRNGLGNRGWFWGTDILLSASEDVVVSDNTLTTAPGRCGIMLIDQGRRNSSGKFYKTRNNTVRANEMTFEGAACAGGTSDTKPGSENFGIITSGNNLFDGNTYRVGRQSGASRFVWGQDVTGWDGFRRKGQERNGRLIPL